MVRGKESYRQDSIEDEVVLEGLQAAVGHVEVAGVGVLLVEGQQREHDQEAVPVRDAPPQRQQLRVPSLQSEALIVTSLNPAPVLFKFFNDIHLSTCFLRLRDVQHLQQCYGVSNTSPLTLCIAMP